MSTSVFHQSQSERRDLRDPARRRPPPVARRPSPVPGPLTARGAQTADLPLNSLVHSLHLSRVLAQRSSTSLYRSSSAMAPRYPEPHHPSQSMHTCVPPFCLSPASPAAVHPVRPPDSPRPRSLEYIISCLILPPLQHSVFSISLSLSVTNKDPFAFASTVDSPSTSPSITTSARSRCSVQSTDCLHFRSLILNYPDQLFPPAGR